MKLYLMRHGKAASPQDDPQQGLTEEGRAEIERLAKHLAGNGIRFSQVFHSEKARAQQTAAIMADHLAPGTKPQMKTGLKPNDDPRLLLPEIENWQQDTLVTSHLPFIPLLLGRLTADVYGMDFVPGSVICLGKKKNKWQVEWIESP